MKQSIIFIGLFFVLIIAASGQSSNPSQEFKGDDKQESQRKCSAVIEGLQFCTTSPVISVNLGENVPIDVSLQNMTQVKIIVPICANFFQKYHVSVKDSDGNKILSEKEAIQQRIENKTATSEELIQTLPICNGHLGVEKELAPQEELKLQINLSYFYDFNAKGKYHVEISRKIPKKDGSSNVEIPLGTTIEVEVK